MIDSWNLAEDFLKDIQLEEIDNLYNGVLAVLHIHEKNQHVKHYSLRKFRRAAHRLYDNKKKSFVFHSGNHQLVIEQIQEQHWLKTTYSLNISLDGKELDISFIEALAEQLQKALHQTEFHFAIS